MACVRADSSSETHWLNPDCHLLWPYVVLLSLSDTQMPHYRTLPTMSTSQSCCDSYTAEVKWEHPGSCLSCAKFPVKVRSSSLGRIVDVTNFLNASRWTSWFAQKLNLICIIAQGLHHFTVKIFLLFQMQILKFCWWADVHPEATQRCDDPSSPGPVIPVPSGYQHVA